MAAGCYESILEIDPGDADALASLSELRSVEGRWSEVAVLLTRRIDVEVDPGSRLALRHQLAKVHVERLSRPGDAIDAYRGVLDEDPTDIEAMDALERLFEAEARWEELGELLERRLEIARSTSEQIAARVRIARLVEQRFGRRDEAMEQLRAILEMEPRNVEALDELERLLQADERWDELTGLLERRAADAANDGATDREVAMLERLARIQADRVGDREAATACYERILERDSRHEGALRALLALHEDADSWPDVASVLERMLGALSGNEAIEVAGKLALVAETRLGDPARAEGALRAAYALDPTSKPARDRLKAHLETHERWPDLAQMLVEEEAELVEDSAKVALLKRVASIYEERLDDPGSAATMLERASRITPEDRDVLLPLCDLYIAAGRSEDAIPVLGKIIESYGNRRVKEVAAIPPPAGQGARGEGRRSGRAGRVRQRVQDRSHERPDPAGSGEALSSAGRLGSCAQGLPGPSVAEARREGGHHQGRRLLLSRRHQREAG